MSAYDVHPCDLCGEGVIEWMCPICHTGLDRSCLIAYNVIGRDSEFSCPQCELTRS